MEKKNNPESSEKKDREGAPEKILENKFFIWICATIIFSGLLSLKNDFVVSSGVVSHIVSIIKPSPSPIHLQLDPAPKTVKGVYLTAWSASNPKRINEIINLAKNTEINGVVIDIKDYTGRVFFETQNTLIKEISSEEPRIKNLADLIKTLHQEKIYVIARLAVFQDLYLAENKPEYAIKNSSTGNIWRDNKKLAWVDPGSKYVWDYNIAVVKEAARLGVDEINLDYIRFPSDGAIGQTNYPFFDQSQKTKPEQIREFFEYFKANTRDLGIKTSADLFGQSCFDLSDMNIGQILEYALPYFDYLSPMVYPSHYAPGFIGYKNPALYPYEIIDYSMKKATARRATLHQALNTNLTTASSTALIPHIKIEKLPQNTGLAELRPWLQVFDLGAVYTPEMIRKQIQAVYDNGSTSSPQAGWYLWNPSNVYNQAALEKE